MLRSWTTTVDYYILPSTEHEYKHLVQSHNKVSSYPKRRSATQQLTKLETETTITSKRLFKFSASRNDLTPEPSPKQKPNPEPLTSGDSDFESATGSPAPEPTRRLIDMIEGGPQVETEQTKFVEYLEGEPQDDFEEHNPLVKSSYFTKPQPDPPY
jgi:hypothetical protein